MAAKLRAGGFRGFRNQENEVPDAVIFYHDGKGIAGNFITNYQIMQNILVPVDFSPVSRNAAVYAAELARLFNARIVLFHAYMLPTPVSEVPYVMVTADEMQKENEDFIRKEAEHLHGTYGMAVEWIVRIGIASDEIKNLCKEKSIDLVVMGMKGAGGLDKIIGSTTTNVIRKVKVPVLVIPHDATYNSVKHITYASDFNDKNTIDIYKPLLDMADQFEAKIHILHVHRPNESASSEELVSQRTNQAVFSSTDHEFVAVEDSSITHGINNYLQSHGSDMLSMVAHKQSFFERVFSKSYTTAMAYETRIPLLVLHDKE